jgi:hypothetical protein
MIDFDQLESTKDDWRDQFLGADPFPSLVVDDFYVADDLHKVLDVFPTTEQMRVKFKNSHEYKAALDDLSACDAIVQNAFDDLNSPRFVEWLEYVTDIDDLIVDPTNLGGGIHQSGEGMYLDVHADFNRHTEFKWFRRLNVLVFLNEGWTSTNGGVLELWDNDMTEPVRSIVPVFNRMAMFATTSNSFHGYDVIHPPAGMARRSFAAYYYTGTAPGDWDGHDHSTLFHLRPGQSRRLVPAGYVRDMTKRVERKVKRGVEIVRNGR